MAITDRCNKRCRMEQEEEDKVKIIILPVTMLGIIREIGKESLVYIKYPSGFPISAQIETRQIQHGLVRDPLEVETIASPSHIFSHVITALFRDCLPWTQIVGLHTEPPTCTM